MGDDVYFVVNRHINYTNVCRNRCRFCAFSRDEGEAGAYTLTVDEVLAKAREAVGAGRHRDPHRGGRESRLCPTRRSGTWWPASASWRPSVHIKAFTASEIACFAETEGVTVEDMLLDLKAAGLNSLPGGGAEILGAEVRAAGVPGQDLRASAGWRSISWPTAWGSRPTPPCSTATWRRYADRVDHLLRLREAQDETGGFQAFIPLAFQPKNSALSHLPRPPGSTI